MRGLAVVVMIQCHVFNSFVRMDLRETGPYVLSQFIGGMAAPLFLFMAGMTTGFQMDSLEKRGARPVARWLACLRRGGYVWGIAYLFRFTNWASGWPNSKLSELSKVDILNCMGLGLCVLAALALLDSRQRIRAAALAGLAIAAMAPLVANLDWSATAGWIHEYLAPGVGRGRFAFFPCASYIGFGMTAGMLVKRTEALNMERLMQWGMVCGGVLIAVSHHFSESPFSIYSKTNFWTDSPALILIRVGICLLCLAGAYIWTTYCAGGGWSFMQEMGKTSLLVYWVHVVLVYGVTANMLRGVAGNAEAVLATLVVIALMAAMAAARLRVGSLRAARANKAAKATAA
jgi:hypothetical protein